MDKRRMPRLGAERNADDGEPVIGAAQHHDALAVVTDHGRRGAAGGISGERQPATPPGTWLARGSVPRRAAGGQCSATRTASASTA